MIIRELLRGEMGFDGLIMTDSLRMRSVVNHAGGRGEAAVRSIEAGVDMVLCVNWEERLAIESAVKSGRISVSRLDEAVERIQHLKKQLVRGVPDRKSAPDTVDQGRMAYWIGRSIGWARKPKDWRPIGTSVTVDESTVFISSRTRFLDAAGLAFGSPARLIRLRVTNNFPDDPDRENDELSVLNKLLAERRGAVVFHTNDDSDLSLAQRLTATGVDVTVVHSGSVLLIGAYPSLPTVLLSYSPTPIASRLACEVLAGKREATGVLSAALTEPR